MRRVERSELLNLGAYEEIRPRFRARMIERKKRRRVALGDHMTLIFENHDTVLFQIQEMLRTERITGEAEIAHEVETYNAMLPGAHQLFATLMIEYSDPDERHRALDAFHDLEGKLALELGDARCPATFERLPGEEASRLPAVNYLRFRLPEDAAARMRDASRRATLRVVHPHYSAEQQLPKPARAELSADLDEA
ncbi:MAG: DUF3501 family protein [Deltaproteobacteria bacterium]|nr:DUF3501 family protein [Deltaproteobacteria bacterium]